MKILSRAGVEHPDTAPWDAAERKGIGHPDTLADLCADAFSAAYARRGLAAFGHIPNHWVDKVTLAGAASRVRLGGYEVIEPVQCHLFGKVTSSVGDDPIDVAGLFEWSVTDVLTRALGGSEIVPHLRFHITNTSGSAADHAPTFYEPRCASDLAQVLAEDSVCNDTVICTGTSAMGAAGRIAVELERFLTGPELTAVVPGAGTDVKVMVTRVGDHLDVTAAVPMHPWAVRDWKVYADLIAVVGNLSRVQLKRLVDQYRPGGSFTLNLNTKDRPGRGYLAPFGSSLGKGDIGAVGRGNRHSGVIEPLRPSSCEAPAGKNPVHHAGKIYTVLARRAAEQIAAEVGAYATVVICARNGHPVTHPAYVLVEIAGPLPGGLLDRAEKVAEQVMATAPLLAQEFAHADPMESFQHQDDVAGGQR
ncbi:methionine adenosyltransferase [Actinomadura harenae]|uniref:Methionine adenosyltransferase n=1 Tax=Actinomadura harenae TaxID=2483351 RepID=A0A3M2LYT9_9ACTN|nr:methionine adenosyltransferase [Actinomadura harenae]RMI42100.1 hypothetical protein EBO15_20845 [Actinomadura harenae]